MKRSSVYATLLLLAAPAMASAKAGLPFIQDDYGAALSQARERKLPLFVECWAPW